MDIQAEIFLVIVCFSIVECGTVELTIKDGSVEKDRHHPLQCANNKRIQLNWYKYKKKSDEKQLTILNPELLFAECSWRQTCSLDNSLVQTITNNTKDGLLYINHGCQNAQIIQGEQVKALLWGDNQNVNSAKSLCNTTVVNRVNTLNLIFTASRSHQPNNIKYEGKNNFLQSNYTCSCNVTGIVKLNVRDIRLHAFQNGSCPSAIANASSICDSCDTVKSNCTHRFKMNTLVSDVAKRGFIFLTGLSSNRRYFNVSCSSSISAVPTTQSTTSASISTVSTSQSTTTTVTQSTSSAGTGTHSSSYGTIVRSSTADSRRLKDNTQEDSTSPASVAVPVVVGSVVIIAVFVVIIYCRKIRKKQNYGGTRISNPAYEVTKDDKNILSEDSRDKTNSFDDGETAETEEDHYIDVADDDRYNEVEGDIDNEYNKIQFKNTPIPVDESYGHINQITSIEHEDYDHIKGMTVVDSQTYSNGHPPGIQCTDNDTFHAKNADQDSVKQTSEDSFMAYDHLGQADKRQAPITDDQETDYSHVPSTFNGSARRGKPNHNGTTSNKISSSTEPKHEDNGMEHDYFVLEPNADNQRLSREDGDDDNGDHQYFVLEPETLKS